LFTRLWLPAAAAAIVIATVLAAVPAGVPGRIAAYAVVMFLPGAALYLLVERRPTGLEAATAGVVLSPVITCCLGVLLALMGSPLETATRWTVAMFGAAGLVALVVMSRRRQRGLGTGLTGEQWGLLGGILLVTILLVAVLPLSSEWWRFRSDAWFHRAVIAQIQHSGLPPEDPYFAGFTLQYMWFYHVLVLGLSRITSLEPFWIMPLVNLQNLGGVFMATMLFAGVFVGRFGRRLGSCLAVLFGLNGLFWLFLPLKAVRAFVGDVTGAEELARTYSLSPFDMYQVRRFVIIYFNQDFLLDKFMVATAFGLAFASLALFWWGTAEYLRSRRPFPLVAAAVSLLGMLGFHTLFGVVMLATAAGGMVLSLLFRRRIEGFRLRPVLELAAGLAAAVAASAPYVYAITHLKQSRHVFPFDLSIKKIAGIVISCAAVIVLTAFQKSFFTARDAARRYAQFAIITTAIFSAAIALPDSNTYDKLPFFLFYPLAVIGGWTLADAVSSRRSGAGRLGVALALALLLFVPVNAISLAAFFNTPTAKMYSDDEAAVASWVRANTQREAVFIDSDDEVFLLVAGPRRYYCGRLAYARQWEYDKSEMAGRMHARDALLGEGPLDLLTLRLLSEAPWELYVIDRGGPQSDAAVSRHPELFERVHATGAMAVYRVNADACRREAQRYREQGRTEMSTEQLLRNSKL